MIYTSRVINIGSLYVTANCLYTVTGLYTAFSGKVRLLSKDPARNCAYDNVSGQGSICRQWDFLHESCYSQQVWVERIIFSQKEKNAAQVMIYPLPQIFFLAIKWPWLLKLFANNMLNIVIKRKREFLDFFRFFSKNSNFWRKFKYVIWSIVYPWKANGLTVKMSMISQLIYQVWGALWMFSSIAAKFNPELAVCHI